MNPGITCQIALQIERRPRLGEATKQMVARTSEMGEFCEAITLYRRVNEIKEKGAAQQLKELMFSPCESNVSSKTRMNSTNPT